VHAWQQASASTNKLKFRCPSLSTYHTHPHTRVVILDQAGGKVPDSWFTDRYMDCSGRQAVMSRQVEKVLSGVSQQVAPITQESG
jgi:hypothetical protein